MSHDHPDHYDSRAPHYDEKMSHVDEKDYSIDHDDHIDIPGGHTDVGGGHTDHWESIPVNIKKEVEIENILQDLEKFRVKLNENIEASKQIKLKELERIEENIAKIKRRQKKENDTSAQ